MRQIVISAKSSARTVEVPAPGLSRGNVLVRILAGAVSVGTERVAASHGHTGWLAKIRAHPEKVWQVLEMARRNGIRDTLERVAEVLERWNATGYSCAGEVVAVADDVAEFRVGDQVACGGGGFASHAEYCLVPRRLLAKVPAGLALEEAAFATIGAIALQGVRQAEIEPCARVAVIGLGIVGQLACQLATAAGGFVTAIDLQPGRVALARQLGASAGFSLQTDPAVELGFQLTDGRGFDVVILTAATASSEPAKLATTLARDRGRIVVVGDVGLNLDRQAMYEKELDLRLSRSYGPGRYDETYEVRGHDYPFSYVRWTEQRNIASVLELAGAGRIRIAPLISHRFGIDEAEQAYMSIVQPGAVPPVGVVLRYPQPKEPVALPATSVTLSAEAGVPSSSGTGLAVIGTGGFARSVLLPALRQTAWQPVAIVSSSGLGPTQLGRKYGFAYASTDVQAVLADSRVQAVCIANRHRGHATLAARALRAGKAVFVEKPLATTTEDLQAVCAAQAESGGFLMVGFNRRFAPLVRRLREFFGPRHGPLVLTMRVNAGAQSQHWSQSAEEGGRIIGEACHFVDLLSHLAGAPVRSVHARSLPVAASALEESLAATLSFANGSVANLCYHAVGDTGLPKEHLEVFGDGKAAVLDDFRNLVLVQGGRKTEVRSHQDKGHAEEIRQFVDALAAGRPPPVPFAESVATTLATFVLLESCRRGEAIELDAGPSEA